MKTFLLLILFSSVCFNISAQKICVKQSGNNERSAKLLIKNTSAAQYGNPAESESDYNPVIKSQKSIPGVFEAMLGETSWDNQTNASVANRIYAYPDGTIGAVWTMLNQSHRGTGYNYFDGVEWGPEPLVAIEPVSTGWPSYFPLGNGEMIVAHDTEGGLHISKRAVKGTGVWITDTMNATGPGVGWPRVITTGNIIHIIACTQDGYQGLTHAILYFRSTDAGTTWESPLVLPGLDAASLGVGENKSFKGFNPDSYSWAAPKGDTIAFAVADCMGGIWIMKSFDNGSSWSKTTVLTVPVFETAPTPVFASTDASISVAMDSQGIAHIVFGRMFVSKEDILAYDIVYNPYSDGLIYWNETMPQLDTTQLGNTDILESQGNLIAWMEDVDGSAEIEFPDVIGDLYPFGLYNVALSSMGQIIIDDDDEIFVTYSSCREDLMNTKAWPCTQLYRHLYFLNKESWSPDWSVPTDLVGDIVHSYDECVYASLAFLSDVATFSYLYIICHLDPEPGIRFGIDQDEPGNNYVNYLTLYPPMSVQPIDSRLEVMVLPNPAHDFANVVVSLAKADKVELNVYDAMGKLVMKSNYGGQTSGNHTYKVNTSSLTGGMYLFSVKTGDSQTSRRVVVE
jgi:hypothetical protein